MKSRDKMKSQDKMDSQDKKSGKRMTRKTKKNLALLCTLIGIIIAAACYTIFVKPKQNVQQWEYVEYAVQHGNLKADITESGTVEFGITSQIYDIYLSADDDEDEDGEKYLKVEEVYAAVGQRILKGDKVYKFTKDSVEAVRKALTYEKTNAQIALSNAQTQYENGVLAAELSRDETLLATSLAQTSYDTAVARISNDLAAKSLEIKQLLKDIYKLQCDLVEDDYREQRSSVIEAYEKAVEDVEDAAEDFVTNRAEAAEAFDAARSAYEQFFSQFDESQQQIQDKIDEVYEIQKEIAYNQQLMEKEIIAARQELELSTVSGEMVDVKYGSSLGSYENTLSKAQRDLEDASEKLDSFNAFVGDGIVFSEGSGIVTQVGYKTGDYLKDAGTLIAFAEADNMTVSVDVAQEDIVDMEVGDQVDIKMSAYKDDAYKGTIKSMTTTATSRSSATISYTVVASIQGDTSKLYGGMTADVTFVTQEKEDVIYVLRKAVVEENGKSSLYVKSGDGYVLTPVETGFNNGEHIEIKSGISAGENYYIKTLAGGGGNNGYGKQ